MDSVETAVEIGRQTLMITFLVSAPMLIIGLIVGVIISILQAATQVQEQTLSFVPKILAMAAALFLFLPWMINTMSDFTRSLMTAMPHLLK